MKFNTAFSLCYQMLSLSELLVQLGVTLCHWGLTLGKYSNQGKLGNLAVAAALWEST